MGPYATGLVRDDPAIRRTPIRHLMARLGPVAVPEAYSLEDLAPPVFDQGATSGCVSCALATAISTSLTAQGKSLGWVPSQADIYRLAREVDRVPGTPLVDEGSSPWQAERAVGEWGVRAMGPMAPDGRYSDLDPKTVDDEQSFLALEEDNQYLVVGSYGIYTEGAQRAQDVRVALVAGYPVTVSVCGGSSAWQNYTGLVIGPTGAPLDHEVCVIAYETGGVFRLRNSWGDSYGLSGDVLVSEAALAEYADLIAWKADPVP